MEVIETTEPVNALKLIMQLFVFASAFAGTGFLFGRFIYSRTLEIKDATIQEAQMRCLRYQEMIDTADDLSDLKEKSKEIREYDAAVAFNGKYIENYKRMVRHNGSSVATKPGNG